MTASKRQEGAETHAENADATLLASVLDNLAEAVLVADLTSAILFSNRRAATMLGFDPRTTPQERWIELLALRHPDGLPFEGPELPLARALRGEQVNDLELVARLESGSDRHISATARPLFDAQDRVWGGVAVLRDVSEQRLQEAKLIASDRMTSVGSLAAGVTHEINNPLAAVLANVELAIADARRLADDDVARRIVEELSDARDAAQRVRQIVRDISLFSRTEEDRMAPVDVRHVIESALRMAWNEIRHRARLVKAFDEIPLVEANDARLGQVFLNLLVNAAQAIPNGRAESNEIRVSVKRVDDRVAVEISDTGAGMSEELLRQVFLPFFTTKPPGVGTGLGLPICQRIVHDLGGQIQVTSKLGVGSTFTVFLPLAADSAPSQPSLRRPSSRPPTRRGRVLVVDDEPMVAQAVRRSLERQHDVITLHRAEDALARLRGGERFDVIFCDVMMPNVTGIDFFQEVERIAPDEVAKIVFLTGGAFAREARQFLDTIQNLRIDKPFSPDEIRALVSERLR